MRRKNLKRGDDRWLGGQQILSNGLAECIDKVEQASDWQQGRRLPSEPASAARSGIACTAHISGLLATGAIVRVLEDGSIVLNTGAVDIGQGSSTVLTQLCADALQVPVERVSIRESRHRRLAV
jgi:CO/xanthine dehydrogenase Mo-binding subunit